MEPGKFIAMRSAIKAKIKAIKNTLKRFVILKKNFRIIEEIMNTAKNIASKRTIATFIKLLKKPSIFPHVFFIKRIFYILM